jgi:hypothetical protein
VCQSRQLSGRLKAIIAEQQRLADEGDLGGLTSADERFHRSM